MDLKLKELIGVGIASLLLFPVVIFITMAAMGIVRIEFGQQKNVSDEVASFLEQYSPIQDQSDAEQSKLFQANKKMLAEIELKKAEVSKEVERLENLKVENSRLKEEIAAHQNRIESLVKESKALTDERVASLAQVYGAMKPAEAAPILLSLENDAVAKIISKIPEVRQQAKIMAAVGSIDNARAAEITRILGWKKNG